MRFFLFILVFFAISQKVKSQSCVPYTDYGISEFVSVTGTGPYTITGDVSPYSGMVYALAEATSMGTYAIVATSTTPTFTVSTSLPLTYFKILSACSTLSFPEYSCLVTIPPSGCVTPTISSNKSAVCPNDTITLTSSLYGECYKYQWFDSLTGTIAGATSPTLNIYPISSPNKYTLQITCYSGIVYSSWFRVNPITTCDTAKISISKSIGCTGDTLKLKGIGISPCATLQWEDSLSGAIAGATKDSLNVIGSTIRTSYRLKSTCPLGKISYSDWIGFTPYTCDSPIVSISAIGGCTGDTLKLFASGISPCTKLQWEDSLSGLIPGANDSFLNLVTGSSNNAYRLKTTCASGTVFYSEWFSYTPYTTCDDSVWAGDVNWDLTVDYLDYLYLGVAYGSKGAARTSPSISWVAQYCSNWTRYFPSTVNYKHADCDGDGEVNFDDTTAIHTNYSLIHSIGIIAPKHTKTTGIPDLYFDLSGLAPKAGDIITVPIKFGTSSIPVPLIYGIATKIYINGIPAISSGINLDYSPTWIGMPTYKLEFKISPSSNELHSTYVRRDNNNTAGFGTIGLLTFEIPPSTPDNSMMYFNFISAKVVDNMGNEITEYNIINDSILVMASNVINEKQLKSSYFIYPNPTEGMISIKCSGTPLGSVKALVYDLLGRVVQQEELSFINKEASLNLNLPSANYILELKDELGNVQRERIVIE